MKKKILAASLLSVLAITLPSWAEEAHHPEKLEAPATTHQVDTVNLDDSALKMREMRQMIEKAKDPGTRQELMHQHMQMMREGMKMMTMMSVPSGKMESKDTSTMPMADRMAMMEKKLAMMEKTAGQPGGMMGGQEMMMGGKSGKPGDDRLDMMEKKMMMMQEMMTGMMMQQEMMMK